MVMANRSSRKPSPAGITDLVHRIAEWVADDGHWLVLGGNRRTAKTAILFLLANQCGAACQPFVFSEETRTGADVPWEAFPHRAACLWLLDDWHHLTLPPRPPIPADLIRGVLAIESARLGPKVLHARARWRWPFPAGMEVAWVDLQHHPSGGIEWTWHDPAGRVTAHDLFVSPTTVPQLPDELHVLGGTHGSVFAFPPNLGVTPASPEDGRLSPPQATR